MLRRRAAGELVNDAELDWPNIAEETESVGISERRALTSHIREYLIELGASPASMPRAGWRATIARSRLDVAGLLRQSPSLKPGLDAVIAGELAGARSVAAIALAEYREASGVPIEGRHHSRAQVVEMWFPAEA